MDTRLDYSVSIHEEDGAYWAEVEELPGCFAAGDTKEELLASLGEAIGLYLSTPESTFGVTRIVEQEVTSHSTESKILIEH